MKSLKIISALFIAIIFIGCVNNKIDLTEPVVQDNVSFALDIQPILTTECATCHNPTEVDPDLREGVAYAKLMALPEGSIISGDAEGSELVEMLEGTSPDGNTMPPEGPMTPTEIALVKKWINEGALDN